MKNTSTFLGFILYIYLSVPIWIGAAVYVGGKRECY